MISVALILASCHGTFVPVSDLSAHSATPKLILHHSDSGVVLSQIVIKAMMLNYEALKVLRHSDDKNIYESNKNVPTASFSGENNSEHFSFNFEHFKTAVPSPYREV